MKTSTTTNEYMGYSMLKGGEIIRIRMRKTSNRRLRCVFNPFITGRIQTL